MQEEIRREEGDGRKARTVELEQQGYGQDMECPREKDNIRKILNQSRSLENGTLADLLRSVYDVLPSSSNLLKWDHLETKDCQLCGAKGAIAQIVSDC